MAHVPPSKEGTVCRGSDMGGALVLMCVFEERVMDICLRIGSIGVPDRAV